MGSKAKYFKCPECGGDLSYVPGTMTQQCKYCSKEVAIPQDDTVVEELDYLSHLKKALNDEDSHEIVVVLCKSCGAKITFDENVTSDRCPYCASTVVLKGVALKELKPRSLLPFRITREKGRAAFQSWIKSRWFAPNALKEVSKLKDPLNGIYTPYWTYDAHTVASYTGRRGDDYYTTEHYTVTVNGKSESRTRQVRHTRWTSVRGVVRNGFDDILILASESLPKKYAEELAPWDLSHLVPYQDSYLSGFRSESYQVDLMEGFNSAKEIMAPQIESTIRNDIGGDHQQISTISTRYNNVTFKYILLPVWVSAYRFKDKVYRILVNARTGEVQGERPYSWIKITLTVLAIIGIIAGIICYIQNYR